MKRFMIFNRSADRIAKNAFSTLAVYGIQVKC